MKTVKFIALVIAQSFFVTDAALAWPMRCNAIVESHDGGVIEVVTGQGIENILPGVEGSGPQIAWHPPVRGKSIDLVLGYETSTFEKLRGLNGGHLRFYVSPGPKTDTTSVVIEDGEGRNWRFQEVFIKYGIDSAGREVGDVVLNDRKGGGQELVNAIKRSNRISVILERGGKILVRSTFILENVRARDILLAEARSKVQRLDPSVCTDKVPPLRRHY